jgi:hypothetical protein
MHLLQANFRRFDNAILYDNSDVAKASYFIEVAKIIAYGTNLQTVDSFWLVVNKRLV